MAHYVEPNRRIDVSKNRVLKMWLFGLFGTLGLHFFSVGRFLTGTMRLLYGAVMWTVSIIVAFDPKIMQQINPLRIMLIFMVFLLPLSIIDIIAISLGKFRDVFRNKVS